MCPICGCGINAERGSRHAENDRVAIRNRTHVEVHGVLSINLNSSPGAGKTTLLEATIVALGDRYRIALIDGIPDTDRATSPTRVHDVAAVQITTGTGCHPDAHLVHRAVHDLPLAEIDLLFIENAGNSACPGGFDLGQHHTVPHSCLRRMPGPWIAAPLRPVLLLRLE
jgi:hydrogenase nickel incorporation protein HypB